MVEIVKPRRRWGWRILAALVLLLIAYVVVIVVANRGLVPAASLTTPAAKAGLPDALPATITVTSWNLGFGALGVEGDAVSDGGTHLFPESGELVQRNIDGIVATLGTLDQDMLAANTGLYAPYDVSADDARFLMAAPVRSGSVGDPVLLLVDNWFEEVREKMSAASSPRTR